MAAKVKNYMVMTQPDLHNECGDRALIRRRDPILEKATIAAMLSAFESGMYIKVDNRLKIEHADMLVILKALWKAKNKHNLLVAASRFEVPSTGTTADIITAVIVRMKKELKDLEELRYSKELKDPKDPKGASKAMKPAITYEEIATNQGVDDEDFNMLQPFRRSPSESSSSSVQQKSPVDSRMTGTDVSTDKQGSEGTLGIFRARHNLRSSQIDRGLKGYSWKEDSMTLPESSPVLPTPTPALIPAISIPAPLTITRLTPAYPTPIPDPTLTSALSTPAPSTPASSTPAPYALTPARTPNPNLTPAPMTAPTPTSRVLAPPTPATRAPVALSPAPESQQDKNNSSRVSESTSTAPHQKEARRPDPIPPSMRHEMDQGEGSFYEDVEHFTVHLGYANKGLAKLLISPKAKVPCDPGLLAEFGERMKSIQDEIRMGKALRQAAMDRHMIAVDVCTQCRQDEAETRVALEQAGDVLDGRFAQWEVLCVEFAELLAVERK